MGATPSTVPLRTQTSGEGAVPSPPRRAGARTRAPRAALFEAPIAQDNDTSAEQDIPVLLAVAQATPVRSEAVRGEVTPSAGRSEPRVTSFRSPCGSRQPLALWRSNPQTPGAKPPAEQLQPTTVEKSSQASANVCAICLSPVRRPSQSGSASGAPKSDRLPFRTTCCQQLFHQGCLKQCKNKCKVGTCPLCRSNTSTGLTPAQPVQRSRNTPPTIGRNSETGETGFVGAGTLHQAMLRRVAAARAAVQRSLANSNNIASSAEAGEGAPRLVPTLVSPTLDNAFQEALSLRGPTSEESQ